MAGTKVRPGNLTLSNHGPAVVLAAAIMLGIAVMMLGMRLFQRWPWSRPFKVEDGVLIAAAVCSIGTTAAVGVAVHDGFGHHADSLTAERVILSQRALTATFTTAFLTQGIAGISLALFLRSTNAKKPFRKSMLGLCAIITAWALAGIIRFGLDSDPMIPGSGRASWIGFGVVSILVQIALIASALWMMIPLRMAVWKKAKVCFWLVFCIPMVIAATVCRLVYTPSSTFGPDFTWADVNMVVILLVETNLMIASGACASLYHLLTSVSTGFLVAETSRDVYSKGGSKGSKGGSKTASSGRSNPLRSLGRSKGSRKDDSVFDTQDDHGRNFFTSASGEHRKSEGSFGSKEIMVRRSVEIAGHAPSEPSVHREDLEAEL